MDIQDKNKTRFVSGDIISIPSGDIVMVLGAPLLSKNNEKNIFVSDLITYGDGRAASELKLIRRGVGHRKPFHEKRKLLAAFVKKNKEAGCLYRNSKILIGFFEALPQHEKEDLLEQVKEIPV